MPVNADALRVNGRLQALTTEIAAGATGDYSWSAGALHPGTYLYQSASHVQLQVQMGLYGALTRNPSDMANSSSTVVFSIGNPTREQGITFNPLLTGLLF